LASCKGAKESFKANIGLTGDIFIYAEIREALTGRIIPIGLVIDVESIENFHKYYYRFNKI